MTAEFPGKHFQVAGHDLHLIHAPEDRLAAVLGLINKARQSIRMCFYMYAPDHTGEEVLAALVAAAHRGVRVQLIIDSFGSSDISDSFFDPLVAAGGAYHCFSTRKGAGYFIRNHQKILIVDEIYALTGGFNITDQYFARKGDESWEDLGVILMGPEVAHLVEYFEQLDAVSQGGKVRFRGIRAVIREWRSGIGEVQWLLGGPSNRLSPWALAFKRSLENGKRFDIASAYFSPSQGIVRRIARVARRNKGSRLLMAGKTDNGATIPAARLTYRYLLKRKAHIYEFQPRPLHIKLMAIDDVVYVGSANLDIRSMFINMEIMLRVKDATLATYVRELIDSLVAQSEEQTPILLKQRDSLWSRIKAGLAYFLVNSIDYTIGRRINIGLLRDK